MIKEDQRGLTYIEILVSILLISIIVFALNALLIGRSLQKVTGNRAIAYQLAAEEIELIKNKNVIDLTNTTTAPFLYTLSHMGSISITSSTNAYSDFNILTIESDPNQTGTITGSAVLPQNNFDNFFLDTQILLRGATSPVGSGKGIFFRAKDKQNGYLVTLDNTNLTLEKIFNGTSTIIISNASSVVNDTWERFEINAENDTIKVHLDGIQQFNVTDDTFTDGYITLVGTLQADIDADDIHISSNSGATSTWQFENDTLGNLTGEWERQSVRTLNGGQGTVTISDYLGNTTIKEITVVVDWQESQTTGTIELHTLVSD